VTPQVDCRDEYGLGVLAPDVARTGLVISRDGELAVALRECLDRAYVLIRDVRPGEAAEGFAACRPWPWMVVGQVSSLAGSLLTAIRHRPILVFWLGDVPPGLPGHVRAFRDYSSLAGAINRSLGRTVAGIRLSAGSGVVLPDGVHARSPELQALIASHPHELHLPLSCFRSAAQLLSARRIPYRPARGSGRRTVALATARTRGT
jgi:hypothetical protein